MLVPVTEAVNPTPTVKNSPENAKIVPVSMLNGNVLLKLAKANAELMVTLTIALLMDKISDSKVLVTIF
jgi:hypothetical protein